MSTNTGCANECITGGCGGVRYEGAPGHFEKAGMACICAVDGCDKDCEVLKTADPVIDPEWEWHMLDKAPGK